MHPTLALVLAAAPEAAGRARRAVRAALPDSGPEELGDVLLVVSELVANAVEHGSAPLRLELLVAGDALEVAVHDASPVRPRVLPSAVDRESGRGLALVAELSASWGVTASGSGKRVWARLDRALPTPA